MTYIKDDDGIYEADDPYPCPMCGKEFRFGHLAYSNRGWTAPGPGDYGLCGNCGSVYRMGPDCAPIEATLNDILALQESGAWAVIEEAREQINQRNQSEAP